MQTGSKVPPSFRSVNSNSQTLHNKITIDSPYQDWQEALNRVFLYLQFFDVPVHEGLAFTLEALKLASIRQREDPESNPTREAMRVLRDRLAENYPFLNKESPLSDPSRSKEELKTLNTMPPLNRGSMVPEEIDVSPWRTLPVRCFHIVLKFVTKPFDSTQWCLILLMVLIILLSTFGILE